MTQADASSHWIIGFPLTFVFNSSLIRPTSSLGLLVRHMFGALFSMQLNLIIGMYVCCRINIMLRVLLEQRVAIAFFSICLPNTSA